MKKALFLWLLCVLSSQINAGVLNSVEFHNNTLILQHRDCQLDKPIQEATKLILPLSNCVASASQLRPQHAQLQRVHWAQHDVQQVWVVLTFSSPYQYQIDSSLPHRHQICLPHCPFAVTHLSRATLPDNTMLLVHGQPFIIPVANMDIHTFLHQSIGYIPADVVRDGLPHFGAKRDDWLGKLRSHRGYDIYGQPLTVIAAAAGKVIRVQQNRYAGQYVKIDHGQGIFTVYVHLTDIKVKQGQQVEQGQVIALINGPAGNAVAAQLHFELKLNDISVDPLPFIEQFYALQPDIIELIQVYKQKIQTWIPKRDALVETWLKNDKGRVSNK